MAPDSPACEDPRYTVVMTSIGPDRLRVMALLREIKPEFGPRAIKQMIDAGEVVAGSDLRWWDAESLRARLRNSGAVVEIRNWKNEYVYEHYFEARPPRPYPG